MNILIISVRVIWNDTRNRDSLITVWGLIQHITIKEPPDHHPAYTSLRFAHDYCTAFDSSGSGRTSNQEEIGTKQEVRMTSAEIYVYQGFIQMGGVPWNISLSTKIWKKITIQLPAFWGPRSNLRGPKFFQMFRGTETYVPQTPLYRSSVLHALCYQWLIPPTKTQCIIKRSWLHKHSIF